MCVCVCVCVCVCAMPAPRLPCRHTGTSITVVLHCYYTVVTLLSHICYTLVTVWVIVLLQYYYSVVTVLFGYAMPAPAFLAAVQAHVPQRCESVVTVLSQCRYSVITVLLQSVSQCCYSVSTVLFQSYSSVVTVMFGHAMPAPRLPRRRAGTGTLYDHCMTTVTPLYHKCDTTATPLNTTRSCVQAQV
jgi:hypothetical protein